MIYVWSAQSEGLQVFRIPTELLGTPRPYMDKEFFSSDDFIKNTISYAAQLATDYQDEISISHTAAKVIHDSYNR